MSRRSIERIRDAAALTLAEDGARFTFDQQTQKLWRKSTSFIRRIYVESEISQLPRRRERYIFRAFLGLLVGGLGALLVAVRVWVGLLNLSGRGQGGRVDFNAGTATLRTNHRVARRIRPVDYVYVAGRTFVGSPGAWFELPEHTLGWGNPAILIRDLRFVVEAEDLGTTRWRGRRCGHLLAHCDLVEAGPAASPGPDTETAAFDLRRVPVELWLDRRGRVRRARVTGQSDAAGMTMTTFTQVDFARFGPQPPVKMPEPNEITDVDPRPKKQRPSRETPTT